MAMNGLTSSFASQMPTRLNRVSLPSGVSYKSRRGSVVVRPSRRHGDPRIFCMAEPYLITKLESAEKTWKELSVKLADPDVTSNPSEYQKLAQSMSEFDVVVSTFRGFNKCEKQLQEAKELAKEDAGDGDMGEMIAYEIQTLNSQLKNLEEKLKLLLLPSDPLDARNILLEGGRAGTGGDLAGIWAGDLVRVYQKYCERNKLKSSLVSSSMADAGGFKTCVTIQSCVTMEQKELLEELAESVTAAA